MAAALLARRAAVYLTHGGRAALERYTAALRQLLDQASPADPAGAPTPSG